MATREQARVALTTKVNALKATWLAYTLIVEYDNRMLVNLATQQNPFLRVGMVYMDGFQIDMSTAPSHRILGTIVVEAFTKEGGGSKMANDLLQHFYPSLHMSDAMPPIRTYAAQFKTGRVFDGWQPEAAIIPFWFDSNA